MLSTCYLLTSNHKKNLERNSKVTHLGPLAACRALVVDSYPTLPRSRRAWFIGGFLGFLSKKKVKLDLSFRPKVSWLLQNSFQFSFRESICGIGELAQLCAASPVQGFKLRQQSPPQKSACVNAAWLLSSPSFPSWLAWLSLPIICMIAEHPQIHPNFSSVPFKVAIIRVVYRQIKSVKNLIWCGAP